MSEFLGYVRLLAWQLPCLSLSANPSFSPCRSRISLISRSDIRYVGTLHSINSEDSTVSLENVRSFGTEGRKGSPDEEVAPSVELYEYIVFRGTDVKDLRVEEAPAVKENKPPVMPNDPAIVGVSLIFHPLSSYTAFHDEPFRMLNLLSFD